MRNPALLAACVATTLLAGCASGSGEASAYVKDAPAGDWDAIHLTFTEVSVHSSGDGNSSTGWHTLFSDAAGVTVDLLNTTGARAAFLGESGLPAGKYQQLRIKATKAHGVTTSGEGIDIALPQGELKLNKAFRVEAGKETRLVIDFDLDRAVQQKGSGWEFKPVVGKVYAQVVEDGQTPAKGEVKDVDLEDDASA